MITLWRFEVSYDESQTMSKPIVLLSYSAHYIPQCRNRQLYLIHTNNTLAYVTLLFRRTREKQIKSDTATS